MSTNETRLPISYVSRLLDQACAAGCSLESLLEAVDLNEKDLETKTDISAKKYGELYRHVILMAQDEWFGVFAGGKVPLGAFRLMGLSVLHCSTLQQAIIRTGEFAEICRGMHVRYLLELSGSEALVKLGPIRAETDELFQKKLEETPPEFILTSLLTWHRFSEWLIDKEIPIQEICLTFPERDLGLLLVYGKLKNIKFNQKTNKIVYSAHFLDHPIVQNQDSFMVFLRTAPYHLVTEDSKHTSPADKVRSILKRDVSGNMPSAEQVSSILNVSVTTLRRQLQKEKTSYQKLKDETRMEAAFHLLSCIELSNNDIAEKLGFDEPSAFFRSFKKWTGQTPGEYRTQLQL